MKLLQILVAEEAEEADGTTNISRQYLGSLNWRTDIFGSRQSNIPSTMFGVCD